jgi:hypothetical protein
MLKSVNNHLYLLGLLFILSSCGLNAEQEMNLSRDLREYMYARNNGDAIKQIGYTHPSVVKKYVEGDQDDLMKRFQELPQRIDGMENDLSDSTFIWKNYYVMDVSSSGQNVEVFFTILADNDRNDELKIPFVAKSLNDGKNWVFLKEDEKSIIQ